MELCLEVLGQEGQQARHAVLEAAQREGLTHEDDVQEQTAALTGHLWRTHGHSGGGGVVFNLGVHVHTYVSAFVRVCVCLFIKIKNIMHVTTIKCSYLIA